MLKIHKFFLLKRAERKVFLRALRLLAYYRLSLKYRPLSSIFQEIQGRREENVRAYQDSLTVTRIGHLIATASCCIPFSTCFSKALAGLIVYSENCYPAKLHIGVSRDQRDGFAAHAWLTYAGKIVLCDLPEIGRYTEIPLEKLEMFR